MIIFKVAVATWCLWPQTTLSWTTSSNNAVLVFPPGASRVGSKFPLWAAPKTDIVEHNEHSPLTSAILRISYDGTRFTGWAQMEKNEESNVAFKRVDQQHQQASSPPSSSREPLHEPGRNGRPDDRAKRRGFVRSVEHVIQSNLAKLYGAVDPQRVVVEGCSRTDKGVHATALVAQVYCLKEVTHKALQGASISGDDDIHRSIPGKWKPHPRSATDDSYFEALPMNGNLTKIAGILNRMLPSDVRVLGVAPTPTLNNSEMPFHPSLSIVSKTYEYSIVVGDFRDPNTRRLLWHVGDKFLEDRVRRACQVLEGTHDFVAFQGTQRGRGDGLKDTSVPPGRDTICTLHNVRLLRQHVETLAATPRVQTYRISVVGDRFLYKMVRFLVGSLVAVGLGKLDVEDLERAVRVGSWEVPGEDQRREFKCAPAHGLVLRNVDYGDIPISWKSLY